MGTPNNPFTSVGTVLVVSSFRDCGVFPKEVELLAGAAVDEQVVERDDPSFGRRTSARVRDPVDGLGDGER